MTDPSATIGPSVVSAVVVSFNTCELTLSCLATLMPQIRAVGGEAFVVDNASADGSAAAIASAYPDVHVIANARNVGFGPANNQALRQARGTYVLLLNSDAFLDGDGLADMLRFADANPDVAVQGPRLLNEDGSLQRSCYPFPSPWRATCENLLLTAALPKSRWFGDLRAWDHNSVRDVELVIGACLLIRRSELERVGLFDEAFFLYYEESDLLKRMCDAGCRIVFNPGVSVRHLAGESGKVASDRTFHEFHRGRERFLRKHYGLAGLWWARAMTLCGAILRLVLYPVQWLLAKPKRARIAQEWRLWARLLRFGIGLRGPSLGPPTAGAFERAKGSS